MWNKAIIFTVLIVQLTDFTSAHLLAGIYCGEQNCYDVLNVTRESTKQEISRNYRQNARIFHPDNRESGDEQMFKVIANAYEILKDDEARRDYDYMLDNPEAYYQNYYRFALSLFTITWISLISCSFQILSSQRAEGGHSTCCIHDNLSDFSDAILREKIEI